MPGFFHKLGAQWRLASFAATPSLLRLDMVSVEPFDGTTLSPSANTCLLVRVAGPNRWAALVAGDAAFRHNGIAVAAGLRILEHRDALALDAGGSLFFTTEELAHIESFGEAEPVSCPRCRSDVQQGDAIVRCPSCRVVHHETAERNCWSYSDACACCAQATAFNTGLRWTPEDL